MGYIADPNLIHKNNNKRYTFVYMASSMREGVGLTIWQGILKKTREIDAKLNCYMGGELGQTIASLIYNLLNLDKIDGIISWASVKSNDNVSYYEKLKGFPFITLSIPIPGFPVVMADSYQGMKEVIEHLIKEHSYTKIAFVRGPENHVYAAQRYNAYIDVVKENNIYNENLVTAPLAWEPSFGVEGVRILLDQRKLKPGKDIEAIVFITDNHAITAFDELTSRKIHIPEQLAITGFNATQEALCAASPITNVTMPFYDQGNTAVDLLIKLLNKEEIPMNTTLPAKLKIAQSCGCQADVIKNAAANIKTITKKEDEKQLKRFFKAHKPSSKAVPREAIKEDIIAEIKKCTQNNEIIGPTLIEYSAILLDALFDEIENNKQGEFLLRFNGLVKKLINEKKEFEFLQDIISIFRSKIYKHTNNTSTINLTEDLWSQARVMIAAASSRSKDKNILIRRRQENTLHEISVSLITKCNIDKLINELVENLPKLHIPGCYISLYENSETLTSISKIPEKARLILAYENGTRVDLTGKNIIYPAKDILPDDFSVDSKQKNMMVQSLNFNNIQIGFVIYELGPEEGAVYFTLSNLLSSAIYGALLYQKSENMNSLLNKALSNIKIKSEIITETSNNLSTNVNDATSSMEEVASNIREMLKKINHVMKIVKDAVNIATSANTKIISLTDKSKKIGEFTDIISDIAEQTKMLALNASIVAARAGKEGRGFSVVAKEVNNLAKRTVLSTNEITTMIDTIQSQTNETADAITKVVNIINKVSDLSFSITTSISEQSTVTNEISDIIITAADGFKDIYQQISELGKLLNIDNDKA